MIDGLTYPGETTLYHERSFAYGGEAVYLKRVDKDMKTFFGEIIIKWNESSPGQGGAPAMIVNKVFKGDATDRESHSKGQIKAMEEEIKFLREQVALMLGRRQ